MENQNIMYFVRKEGEKDTQFLTKAAAITYADACGGEVVKVITIVKEYYELSRKDGLWTTIRGDRID
jgi:hypothetical protein